ncbi:FERM domain-containing protein 6-like, partial [Homarus americanus]|uniref:FERM domain-containing protein 6-like n=1 Tax=Homarus americanus TaxID=6706 RepID=UPI001C47B92B
MRKQVALVGKQVALVGKRVALVGKQVVLVGKQVALVRKQVALVGKRVALVGKQVALVRKQVALVMNQGVDASGEPLLQFKFRVQFYLETHLLLRDGLSRLHYYLQLRENVLSYNQPISEEATFLLASYALQADLGDFCEDQHQGHYFDPNLYFPHWLVERVGVAYVLEHAPHMHRDNMGLTRAEAHAQYIREASQHEAPHNLHLYRLRYKKQDPIPQVIVVICARGLDIYEEEPGPLPSSRKLISTFQWSNIGNLSFE